MIKQLRVTYKTAAATLTYAEMGDVVVNSESDITITLPAPNSGLWYRISNVGAGVATISYNSSTITTIKQTEQALLLSNGTTAWWMSKGSGAMTKSEIEAILTGEISSHSHAAFEIPIGGTTNQVLKKVDSTDRNVYWGASDAATNGIPPGGATNQLLAKNSDDDFDGKWVDAPEAANGLPSGGSIGQALVKIGTTDYMTEWADINIEGVPTGDGTEDTYMGTLTFSGNTYSGIAVVFEMLEDTWVSAIKINPAADDPNVTLNLRTYGSEVKVRKTGLSLLGQTYNTIVLDKPIKLYAGSFYVAEFLFSVTQKTYRTASYLYTGNLWRMLHNRINNFFGTSYSETPGFGLIEYTE